MIKKNILALGIVILEFCFAQGQGLVGNKNSPYSKLKSVGLSDVKWTDGFWKEQFDVETQFTLPYMWELYHNEEVTHAYRNFEIAAGLMKGKHDGPSFHDGDFYKVFEGMAAVYATTLDEDLDKEMDEAITMIAKAQREDGYIHTPVIIEEKWGTLGDEYLQQQLGFEKYNMGHLMTAACVHYRATGKANFLNIAKDVADYLYDFYQKASPELARNAICPSHYMGVVEMYRATKDSRYLELANNLLNIRGTTNDGTDDNQDRIPFREQKIAMGHAVRANYLYAGVADLYAETGEEKLLENLKSIWEDVVYRKMYITGACGALYDGVSPDGTVYDPGEVQKIHQAYGRPYQLPNATAHNETCANIGNVLWNWRMLQITADAKYADIMELALYNSVLSGISLEGQKFCYNNPLNVSNDLPFEQRWGSERQGYIALSNCCPPNVTRTLAEVNNYAYNLAEDGVYVNLYGSNYLNTRNSSGQEIRIKQEADYPWDGSIELIIEKLPKGEEIYLRIPGWSRNAEIAINGKKINSNVISGSYFKINKTLKNGDQIDIHLPMPIEKMEANPLVESTKGQVAIKRGPIVYCLETSNKNLCHSVNNVSLNLNDPFSEKELLINGRKIIAIEGKANCKKHEWNNSLYSPMSNDIQEIIDVQFVPYYSWGNRNYEGMSVWNTY
ncbi:aceric acid hydrolase [Zunongwangia endophytica]|uniref:Glycoside hydrolase family 127 protein n=1 Tax=Zunongwangia endophytica TaxID=1808945 RepID=A0ABV8HBM7_9FLAO|nr:glycoside hydrolase family 127 protein [Zunongwangia endophytica]MDN3594834.1 glycoside hydrolase family 127 protein [Zunongwangia endophytica]